jgi:hypothetical protein
LLDYGEMILDLNDTRIATMLAGNELKELKSDG